MEDQLRNVPFVFVELISIYLSIAGAGVYFLFKIYQALEKINDNFQLSETDLLNEKYILVQKGKKNYFLIIVV